MAKKPSKQQRREKCKAKKSFPTFMRAQEVANWVALKHGTMTLVYECEFCKDFHLTKRKNYDFYKNRVTG
jgi:hypothetical protein